MALKQGLCVDADFQSLYLPRRLVAEERLLCAILNRAIFDYLGLGCRHCERRQARGWVEAGDDISLEWSFPWVCECLGFNYLCMRKKIGTLSPEYLKNPFTRPKYKITS